jgi:hypothetical protein
MNESGRHDWQGLVAREFERDPLSVKRALSLAGIAAQEGRRDDAVRLIQIAYELLDLSVVDTSPKLGTD